MPNRYSSDEVTVSVVYLNHRKRYYLQYRDPITGNKRRKSANTPHRREADRQAATWQRELNDLGRTPKFGKITWEEFRLRYEQEHASSLSVGGSDKIAGVLNMFEKHANPARLSDANEALVSRYLQTLRSLGRAEDTIKGHLATLQAALNWAVSQKLLESTPDVKKPKRSQRQQSAMKGRPITDAEFTALIEATSITVVKGRVRESRKPAIIASWEHLLHGLWWSGLRLAEAIDLHWTDRSRICVERLEADVPLFWIPSDSQKSNLDEHSPMAPEFVNFLREIPADQRAGFVFSPQPRRNRYSDRLSAHHVGRVISDIGAAAGICVRSDKGGTKYASAHDLRRSFGDRWSTRVMPPTLRKLMRHENIQTTQRYYLSRDAETAGNAIWAAYSGLGSHLGSQDAASPNKPR